MKIKTVRKGARATNKRMRRRRCVNAKTRRNRTRRGGSTTEQIGAAAQMRAYFPYNPLIDHHVHQALNQIVHHEAVQNNRYHDQAFNYDPHAQLMIEEAYRIIKNDVTIDPAIKHQMKIAKRKAEKSNGLPQIVVQSKSSGPVEEFPGLPVLPRPVKVPVSVPVPDVVPVPVHVPVANIHAPHLARAAAEGPSFQPDPMAKMHAPPIMGTVDNAATQRLRNFMKLNK